MGGAHAVRHTERLRLEPIGPEHAGDLWRLHQDDAVAFWHAGRWSAEDAHGNAAAMARAWATDGVSKWIAYHRRGGELVGRAGPSAPTFGAMATPPRSATPAWPSPSRTSTPRRWLPSPSATTTAPGR
jgi:hypothetical protein